MRTNNSLKNSFVSILSSVIVMILGFVLQKVFLSILKEEYLGINGLFNNIISMLAIVELGIGPAIVSNLYKPLLDNNRKKIRSLLRFYKKSYTIIGILVLVIGFIIMPFLNFFVNTTIEFTNFGGLYLIFFLFVLDSSISYFYSYKRCILQADQKNRIINIAHLIFYTIMVAIQIAILVLTKNYILFLIVKIVFRLLENIALSLIVNKLYSYLKDNKEDEISKDTKKDIFRKVKGMIYHKISGYIVLGTDNIIISKFLGIGLVGIYSNYYLIINSLYTLISGLFSSITSSVGNLIVSSTKEKSYEIYKRIMFIDFWIYGFCATAILCIMNPFITIVFGAEYLLSIEVLVILVINFYMLGMRSCIGVYKDAAGIFYEDRFIPIFESLINIVASLILVKYIGIFGVFLGTFLSSLIVVFYSLPKYVFKKVFDANVIEYYKLYFKYIIISAISAGISYMILYFLVTKTGINNVLYLVIAMAVSLVLPNVLYFVLFHRTEEFKSIKGIIVEKISMLRKKKSRAQ